MNYYLAEACQNTFILYDCLESTSLEYAFLEEAHSFLEKEGRDDALILTAGHLIEDAFYTRMVVLGCDRALGEFCGNGARACAAYLVNKYPHIQNFYLQTKQGNHLLKSYGNGLYSVLLPSAEFKLNETFITNPSLFKRGDPLCYVEVLEPHLVMHKEMSDEDLFALGKELNQNRELFPHGINLNAYHVLEDGTLFVKTYERGVQRLTRSCGTGSSACSAFYQPSGKVPVQTPGGLLEILLQPDGIELKGPAFYE